MASKKKAQTKQAEQVETEYKPPKDRAELDARFAELVEETKRQHDENVRRQSIEYLINQGRETKDGQGTVETLTDADMARLGDEMLEFFRASLNLDGAGDGKGAPPLDGGSSSADPSDAVAIFSFPANEGT